MRIFETKPALRWIAPVAVLALVGGTGLVATATAEDKLPSRTAEQLLVDLQQAKVDGLSGTVVQQANLGIPAIPGGGGSEGSKLTSLISGTHTLRVWYSGPDKARVALAGTFDESDVITNGTDLWTWSHADKSATHTKLPQGAGADQRKPSADLPKTPQEAATWAVKALEPTTDISTDSAVEVAGEQAYELVLRPKDDRSLVSEVRIAIDGDTHIPLRVQAFNDADLVFQVGYTTISFDRPDDANFAFNPPKGTEVTETATPDAKAEPDRSEAKDHSNQVKVVGRGWTAVAVGKIGTDTTGGPEQLQGFLDQLEPVSGTWGSGRVLRGTAFSAVVTDDGRIAVGSVEPELLYQALEK